MTRPSPSRNRYAPGASGIDEACGRGAVTPAMLARASAMAGLLGAVHDSERPVHERVDVALEVVSAGLQIERQRLLDRAGRDFRCGDLLTARRREHSEVVRDTSGLVIEIHRELPRRGHKTALGKRGADGGLIEQHGLVGTATPSSTWGCLRHRE